MRVVQAGRPGSLLRGAGARYGRVNNHDSDTNSTTNEHSTNNNTTHVTNHNNINNNNNTTTTNTTSTTNTTNTTNTTTNNTNDNNNMPPVEWGNPSAISGKSLMDQGVQNLTNKTRNLLESKP